MARSRVRRRARSIVVSFLAGAIGLLALGCSDGARGGSQIGSAAGHGGGGTSGGLMLGGDDAGGSAGRGGSSGGPSGGSLTGGVGGSGTSSDPYAPTFTQTDGCVPKGPTLEEIPGARL